MKKPLILLGAAIALLLLFRGPIFRTLINYNDIGTRPSIEITNQVLLQKIEKKVGESTLDIDDIIKIADDLTTSQLVFTSGKAFSNPNELMATHKANCVGYAAMFNSIATHLIEQNGLTGEYDAQHKIGKLDFLGIDLHQFSDSPFFKEHDFNVVTHLKTGRTTAFDASVRDYLGVGRVSR